MLALGSHIRALRSLQCRLASSASSADPFPEDFGQYSQMQFCLTNKQRAPLGDENFEDLQTYPDLVFRDFTPFFRDLDILEPSCKSTRALIRAGGWGKKTLGRGWLAYLRKEERLFKGTAVENHMRKEPLIGVHLDVSRTGSVPHVVESLGRAIQDGLERANLHTSWTNPLPPLQQLDTESVGQLEVEALRCLGSLPTVANSSGRQFAMFVDEHDFLNINAQQAAPSNNEDNLRMAKEKNIQADRFFAGFHLSLKALASAGVIPFQFVTGSSRMPAKGFWNGANAIRDLSTDPRMANALGYTWEQIEQYFPTQLCWLEKLHGLTRAELKAKMEKWYGRHRWSLPSTIHVFNPWSVHKFICSGRFEPYWSGTGSNTPSVNSKFLMKQLVQTLTEENSPINIGLTDLRDARLASKWNRPLSDEHQKAMLVGAGMLVIHPDFEDSCKGISLIPLTVPNLEAKQAIQNLLQTELACPLSFTKELVESFLLKNNIAGLLDVMNSTGAFKAALDTLADKDQVVSEEVVTAAFTSLMAQAMPPTIEYRVARLVPSDGKLTANGIVHVEETMTTNIVTFKMESTRRTGSRSVQLYEALEQCLSYTDRARKVGEGDNQRVFKVLNTVVIFAKPQSPGGSPTALDAVTKAVSVEEVLELRDKVKELNEKAKQTKMTKLHIGKAMQALLRPYIATIREPKTTVGQRPVQTQKPG